jgi:hypothetical protein
VGVAERDPKHWLRYQAPSEPGLPGWTARVPEETEDNAAPAYEPSPDELAEIFRVLVESGAIPNPFEEEHDEQDD